jgi:hypothetical protein
MFPHPIDARLPVAWTALAGQSRAFIPRTRTQRGRIQQICSSRPMAVVWITKGPLGVVADSVRSAEVTNEALLGISHGRPIHVKYATWGISTLTFSWNVAGIGQLSRFPGLPSPIRGSDNRTLIYGVPQRNSHWFYW